MMDIVEEIKRHTDRVLNREQYHYEGSCPCCGGNPGHFTFHALRFRSFLAVIGDYVQSFSSLIGRLRCSLCRQTFTDYPPFALPRKRYVLVTVESFSRAYVEEEEETYEGVASTNSGGTFGYEDKDGQIDDRCLAGSTVWRWVGFLGGLERTLREVLSVIREASPSSEIFRRVFPAPPRKYRSERRRIVLQTLFRLVSAADEFNRLSGVKIFTEFATVCSWQ